MKALVCYTGQPKAYNTEIIIEIFNPLPPEIFSSFFGTLPKVSSFRLPTHSRDAHRKVFLDDPF